MATLTVNILWRLRAVKQLAKISKSIQSQIEKAVDTLYDWPNVKHIKKLVNRNDYRLAVGRYRVLFTINPNGSITVIHIEEVKKRDDRTYK